MTTAPRPLDAQERAAWRRAQDLWGVHMHDPEIRPGEGRRSGAPAWFAFPPVIAVDTRFVARLGAASELESIFAHELGHHVLAPSTRIDSLKIRHQLARASAATRLRVDRNADADELSLLANLWTDLLVNTRVALLQRRRDAATGSHGRPGIVTASMLLFRESFDTRDRLWWVYLRAYELLWNLPAATLCAADPPPRPPDPRADRAHPRGEQPLESIDVRFRAEEQALREARDAAFAAEDELRALTRTHPEVDANIVADLVRTFAADPVAGALRFGLVAWPYLHERPRGKSEGPPSGACAADGTPATPDELGRVLADPRLRGPVPDSPIASTAMGDPGAAPATGHGAGQSLGLAETLALYEGSDAASVMAAWYRTQAVPWVRPYRQWRPARPQSDLPGPLELWEVGDDLAEIDWSATLQAAPQVVAGVTTRRRSTLDDEPAPDDAPVELDLYIDSSGSMPHPSQGSPAVLAGTILALSVLRGGGRVRVASFSGPGQVAGTDRFTRDADAVARALATFFAGGTSFPLDLLRDRYARVRPDDGATRNLVVLSDDGLMSMFGAGNDAYAGVAARVRPLFATATLVVQDPRRVVASAAVDAGYDVVYLETMDDAPAACARLAAAIRGKENA